MTEQKIFNIITDEEIISKRSDEVDVRKEGKECQRITVELKNAVREKGLTALSAIQLGYEKRIFVINFKGDIKTFINPIITNAKGFQLSREICHSLPDKAFIRPRHNDIHVTYQTPLGKIESCQLVGLSAIVFQHHLDHLDGLLLCDIGLEVGEDYDNASEDEKTAIINMYLDSLDIKQKQIDELISTDEELKQTKDAIDFIEKVQKGEVRLEASTDIPKNNGNNNKIKKGRSK